MAGVCIRSALFVVTVTFAVLQTPSAASSGDSCVESAVVGECLEVGCFAGHGNATCHGMSCICDPGYCSTDKWTCIKSGSSSHSHTPLVTTPSPLTTTTDLWNSSAASRKVEKECNVREYMTSTAFEEDMGLCLSDPPSKNGAAAKEHIKCEGQGPKCCSLACMRKSMMDQLPTCWVHIAPILETYAKNSGCPSIDNIEMDAARGGSTSSAANVGAQPVAQVAFVGLIGGAVGAIFTVVVIKFRQGGVPIQQPLLLA